LSLPLIPDRDRANPLTYYRKLSAQLIKKNNNKIGRKIKIIYAFQICGTFQNADTFRPSSEITYQNV
jgi:hypothetical protein